jgi:hypothetical protein
LNHRFLRIQQYTSPEKLSQLLCRKHHILLMEDFEGARHGGMAVALDDGVAGDDSGVPAILTWCCMPQAGRDLMQHGFP